MLASNRLNGYQHQPRPQARFIMCGRCDFGYVHMNSRKAGWTRRVEWDTAESLGYLSPGGAQYMLPKDDPTYRSWDDSFVVSTLCNCVRKAMHVPLRDDINFGDDDMAGKPKPKPMKPGGKPKC